MNIKKFIADVSDIFIPNTVGVKEGDFDIDSNNAQYIIRRVREEKLQDSTLLLC